MAHLRAFFWKLQTSLQQTSAYIENVTTEQHKPTHYDSIFSPHPSPILHPLSHFHCVRQRRQSQYQLGWWQRTTTTNPQPKPEDPSGKPDNPTPTPSPQLDTQGRADAARLEMPALTGENGELFHCAPGGQSPWAGLHRQLCLRLSSTVFPLTLGCLSF